MVIISRKIQPNQALIILTLISTNLGLSFKLQGLYWYNCNEHGRNVVTPLPDLEMIKRLSRCVDIFGKEFTNWLRAGLDEFLQTEPSLYVQLPLLWSCSLNNWKHLQSIWVLGLGSKCNLDCSNSTYRCTKQLN